MTTFADLTTTGVSEAEAECIRPETRDDLAAVYFALVDADAPFLVIAGGSNTIVSDHGFDGPVLHVATRGIEWDAAGSATSGRVVVRVDAGESWSALVDESVARGYSGIEALAGIPGSVGAAPVQNIGAYGQELADVLVRIELANADTGEIEWLDAPQLGLGYRTSTLKRGEHRGLVLRVELALQTDGAGAKVRYAQLARALNVELETPVAASEQREAVLRLRASKGMVLDANDPDTRSSGSFFMNPIVPVESVVASLPADAPRFAAGTNEAGHELVKLSAAWLIDHAGIHKGFALPNSRAAISSKHTLAITNRGGATAEEIAALARFVQVRVQQEFGVALVPEPNLIGIEL
ncbi:UDP-N-acetylmuramate dehydrogenase [Gulosibacter bifidus]|uniref:UDP-N-acetylenolpyruvoylglucosamine reductase n=1 Tax=Gulosibacter bifidus TaxID=272239 RepID=A0ABW5RIM6_9MICO|nr:UDP-N-acetylmuramate dehydrogenase [Gulosibacter bifidus]